MDLLGHHAARNLTAGMITAIDHLFNRGHYNPGGVSGRTFLDSMLELEPEIYFANPLEGLVYAYNRLPAGIEDTRQLIFSSIEDLAGLQMEPILAPARRTRCFRMDDAMYVMTTKGKKEIYDFIANFSYIYLLGKRLHKKTFTEEGNLTADGLALENIVTSGDRTGLENKLLVLARLSGSSYGEVKTAYEAVGRRVSDGKKHDLFNVMHGLAKLAEREEAAFDDTTDLTIPYEIQFTEDLKKAMTSRRYEKQWASTLYSLLDDRGMLGRRIAFISANMHTPRNILFGHNILPYADLYSGMAAMKVKDSDVEEFARGAGMIYLPDSIADVDAQIFDLRRIPSDLLPPELRHSRNRVLIIINYPFGGQASTLPEEAFSLIGPSSTVDYFGVLGKAGVYGQGGQPGMKGDIFLPNAFVIEGSEANYVVDNSLRPSMFDDFRIVFDKDGSFKVLSAAEAQGLVHTGVYSGPALTVHGTPYQNGCMHAKMSGGDLRAGGVEMEGAYFAQALQLARIKEYLRQKIRTGYGYYGSDAPMNPSQTLASGSLGGLGIPPTYRICWEMLKQAL